MRRFFGCILCLLLSFCLISCESEKEAIDEIESYYIFVDPTEEGNLEMRYKIVWHVLDSEKEGPLSWIKIGVPNKYVSNLKAESSSISKLRFDGSNGAHIRIDLDREYEADERVIIEFSFLQTHIYTLKEDKVEYRFIPGWFEDIRVLDLKVFWNKTNVQYHNSDLGDETYFLWQETLDFGESIQVDIQYNQSDFKNLSVENTYSMEDEGNDWIIVVLVVSIIIFVFVVLGIISAARNDGYYMYRGFSGRVNFWHWRWWHMITHKGVDRHGKEMKDPRIKNGNSSHHSGSSCACACACACAGGGRAGCSRKDFFNPKTETARIMKKLKN